MGAVAGGLLGLHGRLGLAGWQWLFLVEGLPAVLLSLVFLCWLPDAPSRVAWLTEAEKAWIATSLAADRTAQTGEPDTGLRATLLSPLVIGLGLVNALYLGSAYAYNLSAPTLLGAATHLGVSEVGYVVAAGGLLGAVAMLLNSRNSDLHRERHLHVVAPLIIEGLAYGAMSLFATPGAYAGAYLVAQSAAAAVAAVFWLIPSDRLAGRSAAGGVAAINGIGMIGSFLAPYGWGLLHDATGSYAMGVRLLPLAFFAAAAIVLWLRFAHRQAHVPPFA
jgi:ACS family tartrate transporter-like MFS transporter